MVGAVVKSKIGELEEELRSVTSRKMITDLTCVVQVISGKKMFLVRFQDKCKKYLTSNKHNFVIVENIPE